MTELANKVAVVTGASSGIGKCIALTLANKGVKVGLGARSIDELRDIMRTINVKGGQAICVQTDVTQRDQVNKKKAELAQV